MTLEDLNYEGILQRYHERLLHITKNLTWIILASVRIHHMGSTVFSSRKTLWWFGIDKYFNMLKNLARLHFYHHKDLICLHSWTLSFKLSTNLSLYHWICRFLFFNLSASEVVINKKTATNVVFVDFMFFICFYWVVGVVACCFFC